MPTAPSAVAKCEYLTKQQVVAQEAAWKKVKRTLLAKLGPQALKSVEATKARGAEIFKEMDTDGSGFIDSNELKTAFGVVGVELTSKELKDMMNETDRDGDCKISSAEFENCKLRPTTMPHHWRRAKTPLPPCLSSASLPRSLPHLPPLM